MKRILFLSIFSLFAFTQSQAEISDQDLRSKVVEATLQKTMQSIAEEIGQLQDDFPQLKEWPKALVSPKKIQYEYRYLGAAYPYQEESFGKNGCQILISAKKESVFEPKDIVLSQIKVGVYLKFKAVGKRAERLKQTIYDIVAKHFQSVRNLKQESS